jgi:hypothetical protein
MATLGSKLITKEMQWNANMTEQSHLGAALLAKPHRFSGKMDQLFSAQNIYSDNPLLSMLMGNKATEETITSTSWEWDLKGANTRPLVVIENAENSSNATPGKFRREFKLKLDENWYVAGDVLSPGTSNKKYQVRVIDEPFRHGDGWIYRVILMSDDPALFIPVKYLTPGQQWAKLYSLYEEATEQSGSTQFSTPLTLSNKMSKFRKKYKITDYASQEVLAVKVPDSKGNLHDSWMRYAEVEYWQQWYRELERGIWYTRSTDTVKGANGRPVRSGPGIQEQLEDSHLHYYSNLTATLIEEFLMDIFYSRTKPGQGRKVKGYTGEYGMLIFHRAIQDWMNKSGFIKNVEIFTNKVSSEYHSNAMEGGYQFVRYNMANGSSLELVHNPLYDDREINFEIDPISGYPVESQRITFLDFSAQGGKSSNIKLMKKKDAETFTYVCGAVGPYGPSKGHHSAHAGDYYEMHVGKTCGVHIHDITKCGELILARA